MVNRNYLTLEQLRIYEIIISEESDSNKKHSLYQMSPDLACLNFLNGANFFHSLLGSEGQWQAIKFLFNIFDFKNSDLLFLMAVFRAAVAVNKFSPEQLHEQIAHLTRIGAKERDYQSAVDWIINRVLTEAIKQKNNQIADYFLDQAKHRGGHVFDNLINAAVEQAIRVGDDVFLRKLIFKYGANFEEVVKSILTFLLKQDGEQDAAKVFNIFKKYYNDSLILSCYKECIADGIEAFRVNFQSTDKDHPDNCYKIMKLLSAIDDDEVRSAIIRYFDEELSFKKTRELLSQISMIKRYITEQKCDFDQAYNVIVIPCLSGFAHAIDLSEKAKINEEYNMVLRF